MAKWYDMLLSVLIVISVYLLLFDEPKQPMVATPTPGNSKSAQSQSAIFASDATIDPDDEPFVLLGCPFLNFFIFIFTYGS